MAVLGMGGSARRDARAQVGGQGLRARLYFWTEDSERTLAQLNTNQIRAHVSTMPFSLDRRRMTAFVWIWQTRDSVIPRMSPISFILRSS